MEKIIALRIKVADKKETTAVVKAINTELSTTGKLLNAQIKQYRDIIALQKKARSGAGAGAAAGAGPGSGAGSRPSRPRSGQSTDLDNSAALRRQAVAARQAGLDTDALIKRIAVLKQRQSEVNQEVKEQARLFDEAKQAAGSYRAINSELGRLATAYRESSQAERDGVAGRKTLRRIQELRGELKRIDADMGIYVRNVGNYGSAFNRIGDVVGRFTAIAGIGLGAQEIVADAARISDSIANVQKVSGLAQEQVRDLADELRLRDTRTTLEAQLEIAEIGGRLGLNESNLGIDEAQRQLVDFTDAIDTANVALGDQFNDDAQQVASTLAGLRNVLVDFRPNGDADIGGDLLKIGNALNFLETQGNSTAPVIADFVNRIGGGAVPLGATTESIFALSTTLDELEVSAERGATAVTKTLTDLAREPEKFGAAVVDAGLIDNIDSFTEKVNTDIISALTLVAQSVGATSSNNTEFANQLEEFGITGTRAVEVFGKLSGAGDRYNELLQISTDSLQTTDSLTAEFAAKNTTLAAEIEKVRNSLVNTFSSSDVQDGLKVIVNGVGQFIALLIALPKFISDNRVTILLWAASLGILNSGLIASQFAILRQTIATKAATISQRLLNVAMRANPIGLVVTAVLFLVGALVGLYNNNEAVRTSINNAIDSFRRMYDQSLALRLALGPVGLAIKFLTDLFTEGTGVIKDYIDEIKTFGANALVQFRIAGLAAKRFGLQVANIGTLGLSDAIKNQINEATAEIEAARQEIAGNERGLARRNSIRQAGRLRARAEAEKQAAADRAKAKEQEEKGITGQEDDAENDRAAKRKASYEARLRAQEQAAKDRLAAAARILDLENELLFNRFDRQEAQARTRTDRAIASLVGDPEQVERQAELIRKKLGVELGKINDARQEAQGESLALVKEFGEDLRDAQVANGTSAAQAELDQVEGFFNLQNKALSAQLAQQNANLLRSFRDGDISYREFTERRAELGRLNKEQAVAIAAQELAEVSAADAKLTEQRLLQARQRFELLREQRAQEQAGRDSKLQSEFEEGDLSLDGLETGLNNSEQLRREQEIEDTRAFETEKEAIATEFALRNLDRVQKNADAEGEIAKRNNREIIRLEKQKQQIILSSTEEIGEAIGQFLTGQQASFKDFLKGVLNIALDALEKLILTSIASSTAQALAQPDSVATFGASGLIRAGILTGLIKGAFAGIKSAVQSFEGGGVIGEDAGPWQGGTVPAGSGMIHGRSHSSGGIRRGGVEVQGQEFKIQNGREHYIVNRASTSRFLPTLRALAANPGIFSLARRQRVSAINSFNGFGRSFADGGVLIGRQPLTAPVGPNIVNSNPDGGLSAQDAALIMQANQVGMDMAESAMQLAAEVSSRIDRLQVLINPGDAVRAGQDQIEVEGREGL